MLTVENNLPQQNCSPTPTRNGVDPRIVGAYVRQFWESLRDHVRLGDVSPIGNAWFDRHRVHKGLRCEVASGVLHIMALGFIKFDEDNKRIAEATKTVPQPDGSYAVPISESRDVQDETQGPREIGGSNDVQSDDSLRI